MTTRPLSGGPLPDLEPYMPKSGAAAIPVDGHHVFLVGQDRAGHWIVRETLGLLGGIFIDRAAAIRFARAERRRFEKATVEIATAPLPSPLTR